MTVEDLDMNPTAARWLEGLRDFVARYRASRPVLAAATPEQRGQQPILATHLATWIDGEAATLPITHAIPLTTSDIGVVVIEECLTRPEPLIASLAPRILPVREIEYRLYTKAHPDPDRAFHLNHWSWIKAPVPQQRHAEFHAWPIQAGEAYWLHRTGTSGPGEAESRHTHLWKWTGSHAVLLKPFIQERVEAL
jgi:hypothetical protein